MEEFISHIDQTKHKSISGLHSWNRKKHKITPEETIIHMTYNGIRPTCKCGCGGLTNRKTGKLEFKDYLKGHLIRVHNPTRDNPEIAKRAIAKANKIHCEGLKDGSIKQWNKGMTKENSEEMREFSKIRKGKTLEEFLRNPKQADETRKKMAESTSHRAKTDPNFNAHMKIYWKDENNRKAQSKRKSNFLEKHGHKFSELELIVKQKLEENNLLFKHQFRLANSDYNKVFDFWIKDTNILIEIDGNFWHCNPKLFPEGPIHYGQEYHIRNDKLKNEIALERGYILLRFWESDIKDGLDYIALIKQEIRKGE